MAFDLSCITLAVSIEQIETKAVRVKSMEFITMNWGAHDYKERMYSTRSRF